MPCRDDHPPILEHVCSHFISSLEDERGFKVFWSALSGSRNELRETQEISFNGALGLIHMNCLFYLPAIVQAHLLLLASRCISDLNLGLHFLAFERAMDLYVRYLPALDVFNRTGGVKIPWSCAVEETPFTCCIKDGTDQKLRSQINELLSSCQLHSGDDLPANGTDIDRLIEENQHILHEKFRKQVCMAAKSLLLRILSCATQKEELKSELSDEIICLAAVLGIMSSSLLQISRRSSQIASASDKENVNYATLCAEYNCMYECIHLLGQYEANELYTFDIGMPVDRKRASMSMLAHFATLSLCCLRRRLGFLWKGCIVMIIMSLNLIAEEEDLGTFQHSSEESALICYTEERVLEEEDLGTFQRSSEESSLICYTEERVLKEEDLGTFQPSSKESALISYTERVLEVPPQIKAMALQFEAMRKIHKGGHVDGDGSRALQSGTQGDGAGRSASAHRVCSEGVDTGTGKTKGELPAPQDPEDMTEEEA